LGELLSIGDPIRESKPRKKAIERRDQLLKLGAGATADDLAELGYWQWRLREPERALESLSAAKLRDQRSFWPLANLGTLYQAQGQLQEAWSHLGAASASFPSPWPGDAAAGKWFRAAEKAQMNLLRARLRESGGSTSRLRPAADVDALFPVRFVGPSGQYEAGKLADAEREKIPADAIATVQQLLLWFPEDTRLLWLLGELYNSTGDIRAAEQVFEDCIGSRRFNAPPELAEHRRIVKAAVAALVAANSSPAAPAESFLPDTQTLWLVGGIGGVVVLFFVLLQLREWQRRGNTKNGH
jgi:tetratricopeptide (TPR) repeat protein